MSDEMYVPPKPTEHDFVNAWAIRNAFNDKEYHANLTTGRERIAQIKADALREAADEAEQLTSDKHGGDDWFPAERTEQVSSWLKHRADEIETGA